MLDLLARNTEFRITILVSIASSLLLMGTIIWKANTNVDINNKDIVYTIGISISTSGLATSLVQIIGHLAEIIEKRSNQRSFLRLFGCDDKTNGDGSIAIIIRLLRT